MSLWFVTPAYQRYELSAVCFEQRRQAIEVLRAKGIEAHCVVVADDENLDLARGCGFEVVEQANDGLGRKFNDGMEYAGKHGAQWIVPIGSDSWLDPAYFDEPLARKLTRTSKAYCAVETDRLAELQVGGNGAGPYVFPRYLLEPVGFRPAGDSLRRSIDRSTIRGLGQSVSWQWHMVHPFQYIGFRGQPHITRYDTLMRYWGVREHTDPWAVLARHYPADLVERARLALGRVVV